MSERSAWKRKHHGMQEPCVNEALGTEEGRTEWSLRGHSAGREGGAPVEAGCRDPQKSWEGIGLPVVPGMG